MDHRTREENRNWAGGFVTVVVILAALYIASALIRSL